MNRLRAIIFTDGACLRNGQAGAIAGIGVYSPHDERNNISSLIDGRQTNQRAEIIAAYRGIKRARDLQYNSVLVKVDSKYVKNAYESWIARWMQQDWNDTNGKPVSNREEFEMLYKLSKEIEIEFEWVPSKMNAADEMAKKVVAQEQLRRAEEGAK